MEMLKILVLILCLIWECNSGIYNVYKNTQQKMETEDVNGCLVNPFMTFIIKNSLKYYSQMYESEKPKSPLYDWKSGGFEGPVIQQNEKLNIMDFYSSVWCYNTITSGLRCKFHNICYFPTKRQVIFISSPFSILYGTESISELSENLYSSSVKDHNAFAVKFAVVNSHSMVKYLNLYKFIFINESSILFSRFKPDNLEHIFHDDLLPLYFTLKELSDGFIGNRKINSVVMDRHGKVKYENLYKAIANNFIYVDDFQDNEWICFSEAYIGLNKQSLWYNYNFLKETYVKPKQMLDSNQITLFARSFTSALNIPYNTLKNNVTMKVVILIRESTRKILNINDVEKAIGQHFHDGSSLKISINKMSLEVDGVEDIIKELLNTDILVGMHGAALILALFMPRHSSLLELWPYGIKQSIVPVYQTLCSIKGISYRSWVNEDIENTIVHPEYPIFYGGLKNWYPDDSRYKQLLKSLEQGVLENIECCDDPDWLFRIYQDTVVNVYPERNLHSKLFQDILVTVSPTPTQFTMHQHAILSDSQFLSQVEGVNCKLNVKDNLSKLTIKWFPPWNSEDKNCSKMAFEITLKEVRELTSKNSLIYWVTEPPFLKKFSYAVNGVHVWITPFCDSIKGAVLFINCKEFQ